MQTHSYRKFDVGERRVVDSKRNFYFQVTADDAKGACPLSKDDCVLARACKEQYPGLQAIEIGAKNSFIVLPDRAIRYATPGKLRDALNAFDARKGWNLPKGVYHLLAPPPSMSLSRRRKEPTGPHRTTRSVAAKKASLNPRYAAWNNRAQATA